MFRIILDSLKTGIVTEQRPFDRRPPFGFPVIDFSRCTMCDECARVCPTGAIQTEAAAPGQRTLALSYAACIQCRECVTCMSRAGGHAGTRRGSGRVQPRAAAPGRDLRRRCGNRPLHVPADAGAGRRRPRGIRRPPARSDSRTTRSLAARAPSRCRQLQRLRAGDRRDDESRCSTSNASGFTSSPVLGTPMCCSSPVR